MSFHGGLIGITVSIYIFTKKNNINFFLLSDLVSLIAPIGLFLGRIANFINAELYGKVSTLPWAVIFPNAGSAARHPSQIYEAFLEGIILFKNLSKDEKKRIKDIFIPDYKLEVTVQEIDQELRKVILKADFSEYLDDFPEEE